MPASILLVEDEEALRMIVGDRLRNAGYLVDYAIDGDAAFEKATLLPFDLIILDIMLPRRDGFSVCRDIRQAGLITPILMLTARSQTEDKIKGLKIGADDYMAKPFDMQELMARIEALLRRVPMRVDNRSESYRFGSIRVDFPGTVVTREGEDVHITSREFHLLLYLIAHAGVTCSRDELLREVWGYTTRIFTRTVDMHVGSLRQKIEDDPKQPRFIVTVYGLGYKFRS